MAIFLTIVFVTICALLVIVILLQKGRGGGLSGAFGGVGGHTAFGTKTGDVMTWTTVVLASLFLLAAVILNLWFRPGDKGSLGASVPTAAPAAPGMGQTGGPPGMAAPPISNGPETQPGE